MGYFFTPLLSDKTSYLKQEETVLTVYQPHEITTPRRDPFQGRILDENNPYAIFFDLQKAYEVVMAGDYRANTARAYENDLAVFVEFLTARKALPTPDMMKRYKAYLGQPHYRRNKKGDYYYDDKPRATSSKNRMLVPAKLFCKALADQQHDYRAVRQLALEFLSPDEAEDIQATLWQLKDALRRASDTPAFKEKKDANTSPLQQFGTRLELPIARGFVRSIEIKSLKDHRDKTLLIFMLNTALRVDETSRITLQDFASADGAYTITIMRKGGKIATTPCPVTVYNLLVEYITAHNACFQPEHPAYIHPHTPIFRRYHRRTPHPSGNPLDAAGIRNMVSTRARQFDAALTLNPHDLRRTAAYIALKNGMPMHKIQQLLGHADISTTMRYVGKLQDWDEAVLDSYGALIS